MLSFDGSSREVCLQRRIRTNTPLQALVTLNDPAYVEMALALATHMQKNGGSNIDSCIRWGYQAAMFQSLPDKKLKVLQHLYQQSLQDFRKNPGSAGKLVHGDPAAQQHLELAALLVVANAIMNLDEFLTKS